MKAIVIIGGGLAGLTLGIGLRQRGVPVTLWEAGRYPRHRVCGEFISGNGQRTLERLGLQTLLENAGAIPVRTAQFIAESNHSPIRELPVAIGLSRFVLDAALAKEFQRLGGELRENERFTSTESTGVVRASGRRPHPTESGWRWFGLKVHARNVDLEADLEMHLGRDHYVGVNRIDRDEVNVCGLFRARPGQSLAETGLNLLRGTPGTVLHERLAQADFDGASFCSVAGLSLKPARALDKTEFCIGDALTMIPPVTGNGMSMAFESAEISISPLLAFSRGEMTWAEAQRAVAAECDRTFARRLRWARALQAFLFSPVPGSPIGALIFRSDSIWEFLYARTR